MITDLESLTDQMPPIMKKYLESPDLLYEKLLYIEKNPDINGNKINAKITKELSDILNLPNTEQEWPAISKKLFNSKNSEKYLQTILKNIGFIPSEIYNQNSFHKIDPRNLVTFIKKCKNLEKTNLKNPAQYERNKLLNNLFIHGNAKKIRKQNETKFGRNIEIDINGLRIQPKFLNAHLPFGLISDEMMQTLKQENWINKQELLEARINKARHHFHQLLPPKILKLYI